jgi:hypothetical protein
MRFRSIGVVAVALAAGSMLVVPLAESAPAAVATTCAKAKTVNDLKHFKNTATMTVCTNPTATGGKGVMVTNFKNYAKTGKITATVTWNKTGTTIIAIKTKKATAAQNAKCVKTVGKGGGAASSTGVVTGGTGKALTGIPNGSKFSETVCYNSKSVVTLYPGSKIVF